MFFYLPLVSTGYGQGLSDVLRYSLQYPTYDATSMVLPGVTNDAGFGTFQENPASMALFDESFMSFSLSGRQVTETGRYLGNRSEFDDTQISVGDFGVVYKVPTRRGSLVVGGGYSQSHDYNRAVAGGGRNNRSTLTDFYNITPDDSLFFAAFDAYAIDFATTDSSFSETLSIFRIGLSEYPGINQNFEVTERGVLGEYSAFLATEFQENFMVGVSIGLLSGNYSYRRSFLESDRNNDYNFEFIDSNGDGEGDTDIDRILSEDSIDANFTAFTARLGFVYQPLNFLRIGASYQFKNTLSVDEDFNTRITSTFDNGVEFSDQAPGRFSYKITRPDRINAGISLTDIGGMTLSAAAEVVRFTESSIDFEELELAESENDINREVRAALDDVVNLRGGIEYEFNQLFTGRAGYAYFPSPQSSFDASRQFYSGGFSAQIFENVVFDLGVQYSTWKDRNQLYTYFDGSGISGEVVVEDVSRWNIIGGVKIGF